ncbi:MAG: hypothetical protein AAB834_03925 [Patescibacteria group bacterium]
MNPQLDHTPGLGLPQPSLEIGQATVNRAPETFHAPEIIAPKFETMPSSAPVAQPIPAIAQPQQPVVPLVPISAQDAAIIQADDTDDSALDEEWVNKAREIVERTHSDPFMQSREISRVKAEYIKVRYNKDIKNSEDQP